MTTAPGWGRPDGGSTVGEFQLDVQRWRMQQRGERPAVVGEALLRNYPLRLWVQQREHMSMVLQEFETLLADTPQASSPPQQLLDVAEMFSTVFGSMIGAVYEDREAAVAAGLDRMDSRVPLVRKTPDYIDHFSQVLRAVDNYCVLGLLQAPPRPARVVALMNWSLGELVAQYFGADPTPWAGPF